MPTNYINSDALRYYAESITLFSLYFIRSFHEAERCLSCDSYLCEGRLDGPIDGQLHPQSHPTSLGRYIDHPTARFRSVWRLYGITNSHKVDVWRAGS